MGKNRRGVEWQVTILLDACIGKRVADYLKGLGYEVSRHREHFPENALDTDWIPLAAREDWVVITKDNAIVRRAVERSAIQQSGAAVFFIGRASVTADAQMETLRKAMPRIIKMAQKYTRPLMVMVSPSGKLRLIDGEKRAGVRK
jgi:predicted nuclease of predicted toxin-antitoxin system